LLRYGVACLALTGFMLYLSTVLYAPHHVPAIKMWQDAAAFVYAWVYSSHPLAGPGRWDLSPEPVRWIGTIAELLWTAVRILLPAVAAFTFFPEKRAIHEPPAGASAVIVARGAAALAPALALALLCSLAVMTVPPSPEQLVLPIVELATAGAVLLCIAALTPDRLNALAASYTVYFFVSPGLLYLGCRGLVPLDPVTGDYLKTPLYRVLDHALFQTALWATLLAALLRPALSRLQRRAQDPAPEVSSQQ
jgi:hypothetical protein